MSNWRDGYIGCYVCGKRADAGVTECAPGEDHMWGWRPLANPAFAYWDMSLDLGASKRGQEGTTSGDSTAEAE